MTTTEPVAAGDLEDQVVDDLDLEQPLPLPPRPPAPDLVLHRTEVAEPEPVDVRSLSYDDPIDEAVAWCAETRPCGCCRTSARPDKARGTVWRSHRRWCPRHAPALVAARTTERTRP